MKKNILSFVMLLLALGGMRWTEAQEKETLTMTPGKTLKEEIELMSLSDGGRIKVELTLNYEIAARELTLVLTPSGGDMDRVLVPMKAYGRESLRGAVRRELQGKIKMEKAFKRSMAMGLGPSISVEGATMVETNNWGLEQEMLKLHEPMVIHYRVLNTEGNVKVRIRSLAALNVMETASGKIKYRFRYMTKEYGVDVVVPNDPCKIQQNLYVIDDAQKLYEEVNKAHIELTRLAGQHERKGCEECKKKFQGEYAERLGVLRGRYEAVGVGCAVAERYLREIEITLNDADTIKCVGIGGNSKRRDDKKVDKTKSVPCSSVVVKMNEGTKKLERSINKIAIGKNVTNAKLECEAVIDDIESIYIGLDSKCKGSEEVKRAKASYDRMKSAYMEAVK